MNTSEDIKIQSFTGLEAWKVGHKLVLDVYRTSDEFPVKEQFGLTSQMRRSSVSVTSNIAEGFGRRTKQDKVHFYTMAIGSLTELQNQMLVVRDVSYMDNETFQSLADQTVHAHKLISGLIKSAQTKQDST